MILQTGWLMEKCFGRVTRELKNGGRSRFFFYYFLQTWFALLFPSFHFCGCWSSGKDTFLWTWFLFLIPAAVAVLAGNTSFLDCKLVFLLLPFVVLVGNSSGNHSFLDRKLVFLLLPVMAVLAVNWSVLETYLDVLVFFGMAESRESGLVKHLPLVRFTGDSSLSGGDTVPSKRNCLLLLEYWYKRMALLREGEWDQSPLISPIDESSSSSKEQLSRSETALHSQ
jgi:hypothetical protein